MIYDEGSSSIHLGIFLRWDKSSNDELFGEMASGKLLVEMLQGQESMTDCTACKRCFLQGSISLCWLSKIEGLPNTCDG